MMFSALYVEVMIVNYLYLILFASLLFNCILCGGVYAYYKWWKAEKICYTNLCKLLDEMIEMDERKEDFIDSLLSKLYEDS